MGMDKLVDTFLLQGQALSFPHGWLKYPVHQDTQLWLGGHMGGALIISVGNHIRAWPWN